MTTPPLVPPFGGQPPPQQQQAQAARDVNTASLCRIGQETVQDIVLRTMEIFQLLRNMQVRPSALLPPSAAVARFDAPFTGRCSETLNDIKIDGNNAPADKNTFVASLPKV